MKGPTYNKDGSRRKKGSGRPRGASSFSHITKQYLLHIADDDEVIPVSRVWLEKKAPPPPVRDQIDSLV